MVCLFKSQDSYVICKVFQKEGPGPRNGAQYGRPFNEEDWSDNEVGIPFAKPAALVPTLPVTSNSFVLNDQNLHAVGYNGSISMPCQSGLMPSPDPANSCQTGLPPYPDPANSCQTGVPPSPYPANSYQIGLTPSPDPGNSCQTGFMPSPDPANACHIGFMLSPDPSNSCQTEYKLSPDPANECQIGFMSPNPANSRQTGLVLSSPDPVPSPDPVDNSYLENRAVNNADILSMLDMFNDDDILPEVCLSVSSTCLCLFFWKQYDVSFLCLVLVFSALVGLEFWLSHNLHCLLIMLMPFY